jgi:hypothetical protein
MNLETGSENERTFSKSRDESGLTMVLKPQDHGSQNTISYILVNLDLKPGGVANS